MSTESARLVFLDMLQQSMVADTFTVPLGKFNPVNVKLPRCLEFMSRIIVVCTALPKLRLLLSKHILSVGQTLLLIIRAKRLENIESKFSTTPASFSTCTPTQILHCQKFALKIYSHKSLMHFFLLLLIPFSRFENSALASCTPSLPPAPTPNDTLN